MARFERTTITSLIGLLVFPVALAIAADNHFEKKFTVVPGGTLVLRTDIGAINVAGTSANEVSVNADVRGNQSAVEDFGIRADQTDNGVEVVGTRTTSMWWRWWRPFDHLDVKYTIRVPRNYSLDLDTPVGDVSMKNVKGNVRADTTAGDFQIADVEGPVTVHTTAGDISVEKAAGDLKATTTAGDVVLNVVTGNIEAKTTGGDIRIHSADGPVHAGTTGGNVFVEVRGDNKGVSARTTGGNVDIVIGKDVRASIEASTIGGSVSCDLPITLQGKMDTSRINGTVNGGGNVIYARTVGGNVRIRARD